MTGKFVNALNTISLSPRENIPTDIPPFVDPNGTPSTDWRRIRKNSVPIGMGITLDIKRGTDKKNNLVVTANLTQHTTDGIDETIMTVPINDRNTSNLYLLSIDNKQITGLVGFYREGEKIYSNYTFMNNAYPVPTPQPRPTPTQTHL
ncbi:hypothetical protein HYW54_03960 [Candidatus Gottesmanbacteria bacterium]|nr:hypothetical protein [Candidatus Gottesmanbacteria bacterium]